MKNNIYVSSGVFKEHDLSALLNICMTNGITNLELGPNIDYADNNLGLLFEYKHKTLHFLIHNYFPSPPPGKDFALNLASDNRDAFNRSMEHCKQAVDISAQLKAPFYSVHSGFAFHAGPKDFNCAQTYLPKIPYEKAYRTFVEAICELTDYAAKKDVKLAVENNVVAEFNLINGKNHILLLADAEETLTFIKDAASSNLFLLLDLGHLKVTSTSLRFDIDSYLEAILPYTVAFHLNVNDSKIDQHLPFGEDVWFKDLIKRESHKFFIIESRNLELSQIKQCYHVLENMLQ